MKTRCSGAARGWLSALLCGFLWLGLADSALRAQSGRKNSASKIYFTDVNGEALIKTREQIVDVDKRSAYSAEGSMIETSPSVEGVRNSSTMVFSNGTGAFFDSDTRVEVRRFLQEPFAPQRTDMEIEPSISQTHVFVARGTVALATSRLVAGSSMTYQTPHGSINILAGKVVIEADSEMTTFSVLEGTSVVRAGPQDMGGHIVRPGEQALIQRGSQGELNPIRIAAIPPADLARIEDLVAAASFAKRTVYFEERDLQADATFPPGLFNAGDSESITAFDEPAGTGNTPREIVPIQVVPAYLPLEFTISPAQILTAGSGQTGG